jgi:serine/threonine-protein kinase
MLSCLLSDVAQIGRRRRFDELARHDAQHVMRVEPLGRYELLEEIGRGAMGVVFRARDPLIDRIVAIKTINVGLSRVEAEAFEKRFDREARSAGRLNHPNIVTIYDVGKSGDVAYFAMELLEGQSLRDIRTLACATSTIADIAAQIADGSLRAQAGVIPHGSKRERRRARKRAGRDHRLRQAAMPTGSRTFIGASCGCCHPPGRWWAPFTRARGRLLAGASTRC